METKECIRCGKTVYGTREREADGYRTWWNEHDCKTQYKPIFKLVGGLWVNTNKTSNKVKYFK